MDEEGRLCLEQTIESEAGSPSRVFMIKSFHGLLLRQVFLNPSSRYRIAGGKYKGGAGVTLKVACYVSRDYSSSHDKELSTQGTGEVLSHRKEIRDSVSTLETTTPDSL